MLQNLHLKPETSFSDSGGCSIGAGAAFRVSSSEHRGKTVVDIGVNVVPRHNSHIGFKHHEQALKITKNSNMGMDPMDDLALNSKLLASSATENTLVVLSAERPCIEGEVLGKTNNHVSPSSLGLFRTSGVCCGSKIGQNREGISVEQKKVDFCSPDLTSAKLLRNCNVPEQTNGYVHLKRNEWDLDIAIVTCNSSLDGSVVKHGQLHGLDLGSTKERKESCPVKRLTRVFNETDMKLEEFMGSKTDFYCRLDSDVHLDLQLRQPHQQEINLDWLVTGDAGSSAEPDSIREMTLLTLAPTENLEEVKSESCEDRSKRMILDLNSDPVSGAEEPKETSERMILDLNSVPVGNDDGTHHIQLGTGFDSNIEMNVDKAADECGDLTSISLIPRVSDQEQHGDMTHDPFVPQYSNQVTNEASCDLASASSAGCVVSDYSELRISNCEPAIITETYLAVDESNLSKSMAEGLRVELFGVSKPAESDGVEIDMSIDSLEQYVCDKKNDSSRFDEAVSARYVALENSGDDGCPKGVKTRESTQLHGAINERRVVDSEIEIFAQTGSVGDDSNMSKSTSEHAHVELSDISKTAENYVLENDMSMNSLVQEVRDKKNHSDNSHEVVSASDVAIKKGDDDSLEDGEVRDSTQLLDHMVRPFEQVKQVHSDETRCVTDHMGDSTALPSHEAKELQFQNSHELENGLGSNRYNQHFCIEKSYKGNDQSLNVHKSSIARSPPAILIENRHIKTTLETKSNQFLNKTNGNDSAQKKFYKRENGRKIPEGSLDGLERQRENSIEPDLQFPKHVVPSKTGSSSFGKATKYASGRKWHGPYSKKISAPNRLWSTKKRGHPTLPMLSNDERNWSSGKSFKRGKQSHAGRRDKRRFSESQFKSSRDKFVGDYGTDSTLRRNAENKFGSLRPNSDPNNVLELPDNSTTNWSPWPESAHGVGNTGVSDNQFGCADSVARIPTTTGEHRLSQFPPTTSPHGAREGKLTAGSQITEIFSGNISPNRWAMSEASECHQSTEQNLMREFPNAMMDTSESTRFWRERNLSPIQRQSPTHLGDAGSESSLKSRQGSLYPRFSPNRWTVTEVSDCHQSHEQNLMRDFQDVSVGLSMRAQPRLHCKQAIGTHILKRRSLSPIHQRRPPTHLGDDTRQTFLRSRQDFMHQWFPSRRGGHQCKSPQFGWSDRMQAAGENPHSVTMERKWGTSTVSRFRDASRDGCPSRPVRGSLWNNHAAVEEHFGPTNDYDLCAAGENPHPVTMERKRGTSTVSRFRDASRDGCPSRPVRGSLWNNHAVVEEHFGPTYDDDLCERSVCAEYADSSYDERCKLVRVYGQHLDGSTGNKVTHPDHVVDTHPTRLCTRVDDEFLGGGFASNRRRSIKSRLWSTPGRRMGTEMQEENYGYHHREEWHHANLKNGRKKRRQFNPA